MVKTPVEKGNTLILTLIRVKSRVKSHCGRIVGATQTRYIQNGTRLLCRN